MFITQARSRQLMILLFVLPMVGWLSVDERLRRARDAYLSEKKAHESTRNELQR